ncbi:UNVERIFIED_CONTAM: hypothetical protein RMT77_019633 [Armadillidium vulgare]
MHSSDDRFARQNRYGPPPEFPLASSWPSIDHHLSGTKICAQRTRRSSLASEPTTSTETLLRYGWGLSPPTPTPKRRRRRSVDDPTDDASARTKDANG